MAWSGLGSSHANQWAGRVRCDRPGGSEKVVSLDLTRSGRDPATNNETFRVITVGVDTGTEIHLGGRVVAWCASLALVDDLELVMFEELATEAYRVSLGNYWTSREVVSRGRPPALTSTFFGEDWRASDQQRSCVRSLLKIRSRSAAN
jgi:hypothetical protein